MTTITKKQAEKLFKIEEKAQSLAWKMTNKERENCGSAKQRKLMSYRIQWETLCKDYGILDYQVVRYKVENGQDNSHGYTFGDILS